MPEASKPAKVESVRGVQDILPGESARWQEAERRVRSVLSRYGFREIRTPIFEHADVFRRPLGLGSDVIAKEMYEFTDRGDRRLALRPEGTAPVVRAYIEHGLYSQGSRHKLYYTGPIFRYDRPQAGRYRQHHQFGVEVFGSAGPLQDAEVIAAGRAVLEALDISPGGYEIRLNSNGDPACRPAYEAALRAWLTERIDALCGDCRGHRIAHNVLRILDCKVPSCREATKDAPRITEHLCQDCRSHHQALETCLKELGIATTADPRLVRGFDYYTRTAFEFVAGTSEAGTLLGGGRYDGLVELLGGPATPAVGWGMGIERALALSPLKSVDEAPHVYVVHEHEEVLLESLKIGVALRARGFRCEVGQGNASANSQMRAANKCGAAVALIVRHLRQNAELKPLRESQPSVELGNREDVYDIEAKLRAMGLKPDTRA